MAESVRGGVPGSAGTDTDLLVIGGGPAGCAAVVMADSLGMRTVLVESGDALCGTLQRVPVLSNVLGFSTGPQLAAAATADVERCGNCRVELGRRAESVRAYDDRVEATVVGGRPATGRLPRVRLTAAYAVVATGVSPLRPEDIHWISGLDGPAPPPLWQADPAALAGRTVLVIGADRPLGTYLRAHPGLDARFLVAHPSTDAYKAEEVRGDPRVDLVPVERLGFVAPGPGAGPIAADAVGTDGVRRALTADVTFQNAGGEPAPPEGSVAADASGYCPPSLQHPRVFTAGDLRSARFQRIATAVGSGSEAALAAYYAERGLPS